MDAAVTSGVPVCLMHMKGEPRTMQTNPVYDDVVREVRDFLKLRFQEAVDAGIRSNKIVLDPGFGFGKTVVHNLELLNSLSELETLGCPVLVGLSRKSLIGKLLGLEVNQRTSASVALALMAAQNGASIVRVHDVEATRDGIRIMEAVKKQAVKN